MNIVSKRFFSETTWTIETKLPMNDHWKVLYKFTVFPIGIKNGNLVKDLLMIIHEQFGFNCPSGFKEELSLTLDPMGKMFQNASSLKPLGQLKPNYTGMIIGMSSTNFM
jgi:hypothetical protein